MLELHVEPVANRAENRAAATYGRQPKPLQPTCKRSHPISLDLCRGADINYAMSDRKLAHSVLGGRGTVGA